MKTFIRRRIPEIWHFWQYIVNNPELKLIFLCLYIRTYRIGGVAVCCTPRVKQKTFKLVFDAWIQVVRVKTGWFRIRIMCPSEATCKILNDCFTLKSNLEHWFYTKRSHHHLVECKRFIATITHSLTLWHQYESKYVIVFFVCICSFVMWCCTQ
jgi:hypothetical protein